MEKNFAPVLYEVKQRKAVISTNLNQLQSHSVTYLDHDRLYQTFEKYLFGINSCGFGISNLLGTPRVRLLPNMAFHDEIYLRTTTLQYMAYQIFVTV